MIENNESFITNILVLFDLMQTFFKSFFCFADSGCPWVSQWFLGWGALMLCAIVGWIVVRKSTLKEKKKRQLPERKMTVFPGGYLDSPTKREEGIEGVNIARFDASLAASERVLDFIYGKKNWGISSWNISLLIAWFYPLLFLVVVWAFSNKAQIGTFELLPPVNNGLLRLGLMLIAVLIPIAMGIVLFNADSFIRPIASRFNWQKRSKELVEYAINIGLFVFAIVFAVFTIFSGVTMIAIAFAIAVTVIISFFQDFEAHHEKVIDGYKSGYTVLVSSSIALIIALIVTLSIVYAVDFNLFFTAIILVFGAIILALAFGWLVASVLNNRVHNGVVSQVKGIAIVFLLYCGLFTIFGTAPLWPWSTAHVQVVSDRWQVSSFSFVLFFFFGLIPVINAIFDFVSVGLTRHFIARYRKGNWNWWQFLALDSSCAILLTFVLYALMVSTLGLMEFWGWGIETEEIRALFMYRRWESQNSWLILMATTNIFPTLTHLYFVVRDLLLEQVEGSKHMKRTTHSTGNSAISIDIEPTATPVLCNPCYSIDRVMGGVTVFLFLAMIYPLLQFLAWNLINSIY
jgi:hypothetical protein